MMAYLGTQCQPLIVCLFWSYGNISFHPRAAHLLILGRFHFPVLSCWPWRSSLHAALWHTLAVFPLWILILRLAGQFCGGGERHLDQSSPWRCVRIWRYHHWTMGRREPSPVPIVPTLHGGGWWCSKKGRACFCQGMWSGRPADRAAIAGRRLLCHPYVSPMHLVQCIEVCLRRHSRSM